MLPHRRRPGTHGASATVAGTVRSHGRPPRPYDRRSAGGIASIDACQCRLGEVLDEVVGVRSGRRRRLDHQDRYRQCLGSADGERPIGGAHEQRRPGIVSSGCGSRQRSGRRHDPSTHLVLSCVDVHRLEPRTTQPVDEHQSRRPPTEREGLGRGTAVADADDDEFVGRCSAEEFEGHVHRIAGLVESTRRSVTAGHRSRRGSG